MVEDNAIMMEYACGSSSSRDERAMMMMMEDTGIHNNNNNNDHMTNLFEIKPNGTGFD